MKGPGDLVIVAFVLLVLLFILMVVSGNADDTKQRAPMPTPTTITYEREP